MCTLRCASLFLVLLGLGCNRDELKSNPFNLHDVELQLNWIPDAQHGGFFEARERGFYAQEGLSVRIIPGGPGTPVMPKVAMGRCDFAVGNADQVLLARAQGADIVAVFAAMQNSPRCIMVHESSGITSLNELKNLTLALGDGKAFAEYLKRKVSLQGVRVVSYSGSVAKFLVDQRFAQQGYVFSEPLVAAAQGGDPRALMVSELGFNPYSSVLVTRRELWKENPELVKRMVRAIRFGWQTYLDQPSKTNAAIRLANPEMDQAILDKSVDAIRPLCLVENTTLGSMALERWELLREQLIELQLLATDSPSAESAFIVVDD